MHKGPGFRLFWLLTLGPLLIGCAGAQVTPPVSSTAGPSQAGKSAAGGWQQEWNTLAAGARQEGKLVIASSAGTPIREAYAKTFGEKYGVTLDFLAAKPAEMVPKIQAERRAGIFTVDVFLAGLGTVVPLLGPEGALDPLDKYLLLPEVLDLKNWWSGALLWGDSNHYQLMYLAFPRYPLSVNTDLISAGEIKSYDDLLNPKWKGKISLLDPSMAGAGNEFFAFMADLKGLDFLRKLGNQDIIITRDERLQAEWAARGKYPIAIGIKPELMSDFKKIGAPIAAVKASEGAYLTASGGGVAFLNKAPHPQAARVFVNWLLSKEGQTVAAQAYGAQSAREDVPADFLDADSVRQPGMTYRNTISEEHQERRREFMKVARDMYAPLMK